MKKLPTPRIEIYQYRGKRGQYADRKSQLWKCDVIGVSGEEWDGGDWTAEGFGHPDKQVAQRDAEKWRSFTGWPVIDRGRCQEKDL